MIDIFFTKDVNNLLQNKKIVFMGDSNVRALYKDMLCLLQNTCFISQQRLKKKGETSCLGDELVYIGPKYNGREYKEERRKIFSHKNKETSLSFYFICRVFDDYVDSIVYRLTKDQPDILIINSCLWDITRWGPGGVENYKKDLVILMKKLKSRLPDCLVIWVTAPPISCEIKGGFLVKEIEFLRYSIRFHVMEANQYARKIVVDNGFDVVDSHYHLKLQIHKRSADGIHWEPDAVRYVTNLLLTHISIALNVPLPHNRVEEQLVSNSEENDLRPKEENDLKPKQEITASKISSVIVKSSNLNETQSSKVHVEREEFARPPQPKKMKPSKRKKKPNSYNIHSYLKKEDYIKRCNRNKRKSKSNNGQALLQDSYNVSYNNHHDSGYLSSPNIASNSAYDSRTVIDNSRFMQSSYYRGVQNNMNNGNWSNAPGPSSYSYASNYNPSPRSHTGDLRQVIGWSSQSNHYARNNSQVWATRLQANHQFQLQPVIDFAATDALPFGFQF